MEEDCKTQRGVFNQRLVLDAQQVTEKEIVVCDLPHLEMDWGLGVDFTFAFCVASSNWLLKEDISVRY